MDKVIIILVVIVLIFLWWQSENEKKAQIVPLPPVELTDEIPLSGEAVVVIQSPAKFVIRINSDVILEKNNSDPKPVHYNIPMLKHSDVIDVELTKAPNSDRAFRGKLLWLGAEWPFNTTNVAVSGNTFGKVVGVPKRISHELSDYDMAWPHDSWVWDENPNDQFTIQFVVPMRLSDVRNYDYTVLEEFARSPFKTVESFARSPFKTVEEFALSPFKPISSIVSNGIKSVEDFSVGLVGTIKESFNIGAIPGWPNVSKESFNIGAIPGWPNIPKD